MNSLYLLIPLVILLVGAALGIFFWAVNNGQYDDLETEGRRILFDDDLPPATNNNTDDDQNRDANQGSTQQHANGNEDN